MLAIYWSLFSSRSLGENEVKGKELVALELVKTYAVAQPAVAICSNVRSVGRSE